MRQAGTQIASYRQRTHAGLGDRVVAKVKTCESLEMLRRGQHFDANRPKIVAGEIQVRQACEMSAAGQCLDAVRPYGTEFQDQVIQFLKREFQLRLAPGPLRCRQGSCQTTAGGVPKVWSTREWERLAPPLDCRNLKSRRGQIPESRTRPGAIPGRLSRQIWIECNRVRAKQRVRVFQKGTGREWTPSPAFRVGTVAVC